MAAITFLDVVGREIISEPITIKREVTEIAMICLVYLGMGLTTWLKGHIRVDVVYMLLPQRVRALFDSFTLLVAAAFVALMSWKLIERSHDNYKSGFMTDLSEIPWWPPTLLAGLCAIIMTLALFALWIDAVARLVSGREDIPPPQPEVPESPAAGAGPS
jgi:TRAP-type C4-dicarboxylate transport system permease small subunit